MNNNYRMRKVKRIHFVGVGGVGMGGIAEVLLQEGYTISGSDLNENHLTKRLASMGATIFKEHAPQNVQDCDVIVVSTAVPNNNCEITAAREAGIPVVPRAQMLAELMRFRYGIAVAGTHGKTTTTSLVASILTEGGLDPTYVIGGRLNSAGTNAYLGQSRYLVAEADESDASFLYLKPHIAIVTNIDADHMSTYQGDFNKLRETFVEFCHHLPFYGLAVLCIDEAEVRALKDKIQRPIVTYGFADDADIQIVEYQANNMSCQFKVKYNKWGGEQSFCLNMVGRHNALNAVAAIVVAKELEVSDAQINVALQNFKGVGRRMQVLGEFKLRDTRVTFIDDYGHHPKEISVTLAALKEAYQGRRVIMIYQPHRFTRTRDLYDDFVNVLSECEVLLLLEVYSAGESLIAGADSRSLCKSIRRCSSLDPILVTDESKLLSVLENIVKDGDILLFQGAGSIGALSVKLSTQCDAVEAVS